MRDRLVVALVGMTVAMIAMYGVPRAYLLADFVQDQEERKVSRSADLMAVVMEQRARAGVEVDEEFLEGLLSTGTTIEHVDDTGDVTTAGPPRDDAADLVETRELAGGGRLTLSRSGNLVSERISDALLPLVLIGLGLTLFAGVVGYLLARRLARPFRELADSADRLSEARFDVDPPHYGMAEADAIGSALRRASTQLDELLRRERDFTANASHQLRTPITALRLGIEDLTMWPETPPAVADELRSHLSELDRLTDAITEILDLARGRRLGDLVEVDLTALVADVVDRIRPQVTQHGREIVHRDGGPVPARVVPGPVVQVLDVLIDNACKHGAGLIEVGADEHPDFVRVTVRDEGPRSIDDSVFRRGDRGAGRGDGHGLGLAIASELAVSLGGHLTLLDEPTTTFALALPRRTAAPDAGERQVATR